MKNGFSVIIKRFIVEGIIEKWKFFLFVILLFASIDFIFVKNVSNVFSESELNIKVGIADMFMNLFLGNPPFSSEENQGINIQMIWFVFHSLIFCFVAYYATSDLKNGSYIFLIKIKSKIMWWLCRVLWCAVFVLIYYFLFFIVSCAFACLFGSISFTPNQNIASAFWELDLTGLSDYQFWFDVFFLPLIISIAISIVEMTICLVLKPILSLIIVIGYIIVCEFYSEPYLLFNYIMILRDNFMGVKNINNEAAFFIAVSIIAFCSIIGSTIIKKKDMI